MKNYKPYLLTVGLVATTALFSLLGKHWEQTYYQQDSPFYQAESTDNELPFVHAMLGFHDGLLQSEWKEASLHVLAATPKNVPEPSHVVQVQTIYEKLLLSSFFHREAITRLPLSSEALVELTYDIFSNPTALSSLPAQEVNKIELPIADSTASVDEAATDNAAADTPPLDGAIEEATAELPTEEVPETYEFTTVEDDYFADAVFIGDSRTVGICEYSGITNATFLCKTSLTIYDYEKPYVTFQGQKMSVKDALSRQQFAKVYIMVGINECGYGTTEKYLEVYQAVIEDIRALQPEALIFIQGNLLITTLKSQSGGSITNERLRDRNAAIATLANQHDIFYVDVNESSLCQDGALIAEYTWDHVHIKAQYYAVWKEFLLAHGIVI